MQDQQRIGFNSDPGLPGQSALFLSAAKYGTRSGCRFGPEKVLPCGLKSSDNFSQPCKRLKIEDLRRLGYSAEISVRA